MTFRLLLIPLSIIYYIITLFRNKFYDWNIIKIYESDIPVISVGNITTGGTGKTPFVEFLVSYYIKAKIKTAIISRGYKRKSNETLSVLEGKNILCGIDECGDEIFMLADNFINQDNVFIAVGKNKFEALKFVCKKYNPDVIILDDGFQYRRIKKKLDIVLIDGNEIIRNKITQSLLLPSGDLRESKKSLKRADIIIENHKFYNFQNSDYSDNIKKEIYEIKYEYAGLFDGNRNKIGYCKKAIAFCGIARPHSFYLALEKLDIELTERINFNDHHNYKYKDISKLESKYNDGLVFITTEKDFVKIKQFNEFIKTYPVYFLKIKINFNDSYESFNKELFNILKTQK